MGLRGIKSRVFVQFWLLFFLSTIFIDVLVAYILLERSISRYVDQKRVALTIACESSPRTGPEPDRSTLKEEGTAFPKGDRFFYVKRGQAKEFVEPSGGSEDPLVAAVLLTLDTGQAATLKTGKTVGALFRQHQAVILTCPVTVGGETIAAGGLESTLSTLYYDFRTIQKSVFVFVVINSFFFALLGNRQLSRIYFRPLKRLAKRAEAYQDQDSLFFSVRKEDDEFFILSSSLNKMLHRIADDKRVLKETIDSLKKANIELVKAQDDVIRAEKFASVGRLTSGIAHEIGNPIGIVLGYLDLLKQPDLAADEHADFIARSEKEITRVNHIIRQLLDMSRSSAGEPKPTGIHQLLQDLVLVFDYQPAASKIAFEASLDAADDRVFADPDRLRQVFLNILLNAVDALHERDANGAKIRLATESGTRSDPPDPLGRPGYIRVTIQDNGPGIQAAHLPHVFDPFFTTKPPGKGTGLGLSVSFMIVEKLGGHISVSNRGEAGACFQVTLPLAVQPANDSSGP